MSQDTFNKIVTTSLLLYAMIMYAWSFLIQRQLDIAGYSVLIAPVITHTIHLVTNKTTQVAPPVQPTPGPSGPLE